MTPQDCIFMWFMIVVAFLLGLVIGWDEDGYKNGVNDGFGYRDDPLDRKYARAAKILRGRRIPPE